MKKIAVKLTEKQWREVISCLEEEKQNSSSPAAWLRITALVIFIQDSITATEKRPSVFGRLWKLVTV